MQDNLKDTFKVEIMVGFSQRAYNSYLESRELSHQIAFGGDPRVRASGASKKMSFNL